MYTKILVPLDGSKLAECVIEHVSSVAKGCQVQEVILFHVMKSLPVLTRPSSMGSIDVSHDTPGRSETDYRYEREKMESEAREFLAEIAESLKKEGMTVSIDVSRGDPAEEIMTYAKLKKADLIIMSTHGRSGVSRWAFGSVADRVVRHSVIPVLIAVPKGCRFNK